ncbi:MAG TPA: T9SS type A sorting domain-containing protein [Hanamia sp.]
MKMQLLLSFILFGLTANAKTYYISNSGNDGNSGTDPSTAWQTINKVNSFGSFAPGDSILFNRGDTFYGSISISNSGSLGNPITFGAYGSGANPVITGFTTVSAWTNLGSNIWESTLSVSTLPSCNMVKINGVNTPMGRYPNAGYLPFQSDNNSSYITSSSLTGTPNWTGADVVIKKDRWTLEIGNITSQSGGTLNYTCPNLASITTGTGFFIQNDIRTLDTANEWYYNPKTGKIDIYSTNSPTNVQVATVQNLMVAASGVSYISVMNLSFIGSNSDALNFNNNDNSNNYYYTVTNCNISFAGRNGITAWEHSDIENNNINNINNTGLDGSGNSTTLNNSFKDVGLLPGMTQTYSIGTLCIVGDNALIQYNSIDSSGYIGIRFKGNNIKVRNNFVNHSCLIKDDGGGIYTWGVPGDGSIGREITGNIVLNSIGTSAGTNDQADTLAHGIYLDAYSVNVLISGNTVSGCSSSGLLISNNQNITITNNTAYNNSKSVTFAKGEIQLQYICCLLERNITMKNNMFIAKTPAKPAMFCYTVNNDINSFFSTSDSNYFARPINDNTVITLQANSGTTNTISQWKTFSSQDAHSSGSPKPITSTDSLTFLYNATTSPVTTPLPYKYIDIKGTSYKGSITLQPYTSAVLIQNGSVAGIIAAPFVNAGKDQTIQLPLNSINLSGIATDTVGKISTYQWTKISGPSAYNIVNPDSAATTVSGLAQGVYNFQLTVTDNNGAIGTSTVQITVIAPANIPPTSNAGPNQTITLPINNVNLSGSGSDSVGIIDTYQWTKISGPSAYNIVSPDSSSTNVSGLTQGIYTFQLTVANNYGAIGTATVQITVDSVANIPPTANAGTNQTITLPTNTVSLSGSGSETDGTISYYQWQMISGPSTYNFVNSSSSVTQVTGLSQGVYTFQLTVTDNNGATGTATVQITVNAATNIPPTANAGSNQTITLPTNSISLSGSGSDADGTISSYQWTKISGPSGYDILSPNSASTNVSELTQGVYQFQLTVTDNDGAIGTASVQVIVSPAVDIAPIADAGSDISINLPANSESLTGSGTDEDGTITSYQWTKISGPAANNIVNPGSASTIVSGLVQGVYQFQLTVTDNNGQKGTASVQVAVNATPNIPPTANAGSNQSITLPTNSINLSGSGIDADGTIASYQWTEISGPSSPNIVNSSSPVTVVSSLVQGVYQFQLTVTDNDGAIGIATTQVTVNPSPNVPPTANAGTNQTITLPTNSVSLSGSGNDTDGTISSYQWTEISGPSAYNVVNPTSAATNVTGLVQGVYQFQLTVTDNEGAKGTSIVQVQVNAAVNLPPTANAGPFQTITLPTNSVNLSGSGNDPDGTIVSYQWTKISGPSEYNIVNPSTPATGVSNLVQGVYHFQLKVTDNNSAIGTATVQITVNAAANIPPTANAGANQTITLPANTISLAGSGSDADGKITSYQWTKISGPSTYNIVNSYSPVTDVSGLVQGIYHFQLTVTDNNGAIGTSRVQITVNAAVNVPPTANAGSNQSITLPTNSVSLSGSGSDTDGSIAAYQWTKISGPSAYNIVSPDSAATNVSGLAQGVYIFQLIVTDNNGAIGTSTVQITVNAAANLTPIANAGSNQTITLPTNSINLSGSGSDADGTISTFKWTKISGPSNYNIVNPSSPVTVVSGLVQGVYNFQLTVTDNLGVTGTATIQVTVSEGINTALSTPNTAPIANAGNDTTIIYPDNSITLNGSGADADGNVVSYLWNQVSGPSGSTIFPNNTASTNISNLVEGNYEFELTVTDDKGFIGKDTVNVIVAAGRFARESNSIKVYPNPVKDIANLVINTAQTNTDIIIAMTDLTGKSVYREEFVSSTNSVTKQINMSGLIKGTYIITLYFNGIEFQSIEVIRM